MDGRADNPERFPEPAVPPGLGPALRRAYPDPAADTAALDDAVMRAANAGRRRRPVLARIGGPLAAAAALVLAAVGGWLVLRPAVPGTRGLAAAGGPSAAGPSDRVTILDAFALARMLRDRGGSAGLGPAWDATGDGVIDRSDVNALAHRAVRLAAPPSVTAADAPPAGGGV